MNYDILITILASAFILFAVFLLGRILLLWYWKVDNRVKSLEEIKSALQVQNEIITQQLDIMQLVFYKCKLNKLQVKNKLSGEIFILTIEEWFSGTYDKRRYQILNVE